jgi:hypothetical protein
MQRYNAVLKNVIFIFFIPLLRPFPPPFIFRCRYSGSSSGVGSRESVLSGGKWGDMPGPFGSCLLQVYMPEKV